MTSFLRSLTHQAIFCILAAVLLQGCGADRAAPYNPQVGCSSSSSSSSSNSSLNSSASSTSSSSSSTNSCASSTSSSSSSSSSVVSSSSSSSLPAIEVSEVWAGSDTVNSADQGERAVKAFREQAGFDQIVDNYVDHNAFPTPDFVDGQVVLVYGGTVKSCEQHLDFVGPIKAEDVSDTSVKITLTYIERPTLTNCSSSTTRPFAFYSVKSRKLAVFEEKIIQ